MMQDEYVLVQAHLNNGEIKRTIMPDYKVEEEMKNLMEESIKTYSTKRFSWIPFENIVQGISEREYIDAKKVVCIATRKVRENELAAIIVKNGGK